MIEKTIKCNICGETINESSTYTEIIFEVHNIRSVPLVRYSPTAEYNLNHKHVCGKCIANVRELFNKPHRQSTSKQDD